MEDNELVAAVKAGDGALVQRALNDRPDLANSVIPPGISLLMLACYRRDAGLQQALLAAGARAGVFEAAALGMDAVVRERLAGEPRLAREFAADGFTPLHLAAFFGHARTVGTLLQQGADAKAVARNASRVTPLHSAAAGNDTDAVTALLRAGADPDARQEHDYTPLHSAANNGNRAMAEALLAHGADPALRADDGRDAARIAADAGHDELAELLRATAG